METIQDKMWRLLDALNDKTSRQEIKWRLGGAPSTFRSEFADFYVRISADQKNQYYLDVLDTEGNLLERLTSQDRMPVPDADATGLFTGYRDAHDGLGQLYDSVRRQTLGVSFAIDNILSKLGVQA